MSVLRDELREATATTDKRDAIDVNTVTGALGDILSGCASRLIGSTLSVRGPR